MKAKFKQNIDAIKLLKQLESEGRKATPSEQEILAKFNGWGTLTSAFSGAKDWAKENQQLRELLTPEEYEAARGATLNAYYTSPEIARTIWAGLERLGFKGGRILDPSTGSGIFFGTMPREIMAQSVLSGVELDDLTGRIAQQLYQGANVQITGFQNATLPDNHFDLAISNVPFDSVRILEDPKYRKDKLMLHNYFFAKAMDKIRPCGLVAFITSSGTLNDPKAIADVFNGRADLIAAFKLPSQTFQKNADTQVTTDVVIFQKRFDPKVPSEHAQAWENVKKISVTDKTGKPQDVKLNEYFENHPDHMLGTPTIDTLYAGQNRLALDGTGRNTTKELGDLMSKLPENIYLPIRRATPSTADAMLTRLNELQKEGTFATHEGKIYRKQGDQLVELSGKDAQTVKDYLSLQKTLDALLAKQLDPATTDEKLSDLRKQLNQKYDAFVVNSGYLNAPQNVKLLSADPNFGRVAAIEDYQRDKQTKKSSASKTAIFFKRTTSTKADEPTHADTSIDALSLSLSTCGKVDMQYISDLTGKSESELERELGDYLYRNPETNSLELAEEYLSGNVREKLAQAQKAAKKNPAYKRNVEALQKIQPVDLTEQAIFTQIGATWIDPKYYEEFARHMLGGNICDFEIVYSKSLGMWQIMRNKKDAPTWSQNYQKWTVIGTSVDEKNFVFNFFDFLERALNKKSITIKTLGDYDPVKTAQARNNIETIRKEFEQWVWSDPERKADLLETYNALFNSHVLRNYDGSHLQLNSVAKDVREKLYPHQKDVIWRIMQGQNTLIAHCVGAGKTWSMQIAAMEMKRIGMINKPLFVVPNATVGQFEGDFYKAFPKSKGKVLVLTSKNLAAATPSKNETPEAKQARLFARRKMLSKIATGDWDAIIITADLFQRLPVSPEAERRFIEEQLRLLEAEKRALVGVDKEQSKRFVSDLERAKKNLEQQLKAVMNPERRENMCIPFDELGIDQIFVDEADMFKNLYFKSRFATRSDKDAPKVRGVANTGSDRSWDMFLKTRALSELRRNAGKIGGGVVFATGTPVSNSFSEIFTMTRYLANDRLQETGIEFFDAWAQAFVKGIPRMELSTSGKGFDAVIRLRLTNFGSLITAYREFADIKMPEDLPYLKRPNLKNNTRTIVEIPMSEAYEKFLLDVQDRATAIHNGGVDPHDDNFLKITNDLRQASLDMRLIDPKLSEAQAGAKINALCDTATAKYHETADVQGTQVIFADLSIPKPKKDDDTDDKDNFDNEAPSADETAIYDRIKQGLIKRGIPTNQIAFVHDAEDSKQRQALFDKVNAAEIRFIIGSTTKMGVGVNIQKHLVAAHHLDCPWRPRDIEQREGRILRAGNENAEVEIFTYVTKDTYDANMWEKVTIKKKMMDAFLRGDSAIREIDDIESNETLDYDAIMQRTITDTETKEIAQLNRQLEILQADKAVFAVGKKELLAKQKTLSAKIPQYEQRIKNMQSDIAEKISTKGDAFKMKIGDTVYTDRVEAGKVFDELVKNFSMSTSTKVGEIGGFDINMRAEHTMINRDGVMEVNSTQVFVKLSKRGIYSAEPSLRSIEYFISQGGIEKALASAQNELKTEQARLAAVEENLTRPFDKQAEFDEVQERLRELQKKFSPNIENAETYAENITKLPNKQAETSTTPESQDELQDIEDSPNGRLEYLGGITQEYRSRTKGGKAIRDAKHGAIIQIVAEDNNGETHYDYYRVDYDYLQRVNHDGGDRGESFSNTQKNLQTRMPLLDAGSFKLKSIRITEKPTDIDAKKLVALVHKNQKTDSHPALKRWVERREKRLAEAKNPYVRESEEEPLLNAAIFKPSDEQLRKDEAYFADMYPEQVPRVNETSDTAGEQTASTEQQSAGVTKTFDRDGKFDGSIDDGLTAIVNAPVGTKINVHWFGRPTPTEHEITERDGQKILSVVPYNKSNTSAQLNRKDVYNFFVGSANITEITIDYPQGYDETASTTQANETSTDENRDQRSNVEIRQPENQDRESSAETPKATLDIRTRSNGSIDFCAVNNQRQTFAEAVEHAIEISPDAPIKISVDGKTVTYDAHIGNSEGNFSNVKALQKKIRDILNGKTDEEISPETEFSNVKNNTATNTLASTTNEKNKVTDELAKLLREATDKANYIMTVYPQNGETGKMRLEGAKVSVDGNGFNILTAWGKILGHYDTPEQVRTVIQRLKEAVDGYDSSFQFPPVVGLAEVDEDLTNHLLKVAGDTGYMTITCQDGVELQMQHFKGARIVADGNGFNILNGIDKNFGHYDTPEQVRTVIQRLKETIDDGKINRFTFPTVDELEKNAAEHKNTNNKTTEETATNKESTANSSVISAEHKAWQKNWDDYERNEKTNSGRDILSDYCEFNINVGDNQKYTGVVNINWLEDSNSGRVIKDAVSKANYGVTYHSNDLPLGNLLGKFHERLKNIAESTGGQIRDAGNVDINSYEFDDYESATKFATTIKSELEKFTTEHKAEINKTGAEQRRAQAERQAPPPKWEAPHRDTVGIGESSRRATERLRIGDEFIELTYKADDKTYPVVKLDQLKLSLGEKTDVAIEAPRFGGKAEMYDNPVRQKGEPRYIESDTEYRFDDYDSAKKFAETIYESHYANVVRAKQEARTKSSLRGSGDTSRDNIVEPRTQQQRILQRLGQDIGQRVVFFDNPNKDFHGAHVGNTTFLNVNSEFALPQVFWHETAHWLKLNNPELYRRLVKAAGITDAQRKAYLENTERTDLKTDAAIDEEIIADRMEDVFKRAGFLRDIGRKDQNLIERLIAWLQDMLSKFREYFQNPQGKLTRAQAQRMANELGRTAQDIVNQRGEKIFRYNAKT
ncbi:MAG: hypothetical protein IJ774_10045, partial [Selenomonadaceae bacterium]|nr:hypothetical protein [Selenomonadaceae bacterium]